MASVECKQAVSATLYAKRHPHVLPISTCRCRARSWTYVAYSRAAVNDDVLCAPRDQRSSHKSQRSHACKSSSRRRSISLVCVGKLTHTARLHSSRWSNEIVPVGTAVRDCCVRYSEERTLTADNSHNHYSRDSRVV